MCLYVSMYVCECLWQNFFLSDLVEWNCESLKVFLFHAKPLATRNPYTHTHTAQARMDLIICDWFTACRSWGFHCHAFISHQRESNGKQKQHKKYNNKKERQFHLRIDFHHCGCISSLCKRLERANKRMNAYIVNWNFMVYFIHEIYERFIFIYAHINLFTKSFPYKWSYT